ncbi:MAG: NUDIX hydrolase [Patescibacteria group bacterium]
MTKWLYCPECKSELDNSGEFPACPSDHFVKYRSPVASSFVFIRKMEKYLFLKRNIEPRFGSWTVPGGFSDYGESAEQTAVREIMEETGIVIDPTSLVYIGSFFEEYGDKYGTINLGLAFHVDVDDANIKINSESSEYVWVSLDEAPEIPASDVSEALKCLKQISI